MRRRVLLVIVLFSTLFMSFGQIFWKMGVKNLSFAHLASFLNWPFFLGFLAYGVGSGLFLLALEKGEVSVVFPMVATSFVWVSAFSPYLFPNEHMNLLKWSGVLIILMSVSLLGLSAKKKVEVVVEE